MMGWGSDHDNGWFQDAMMDWDGGHDDDGWFEEVVMCLVTS